MRMTESSKLQLAQLIQACDFGLLLNPGKTIINSNLYSAAIVFQPDRQYHYVSRNL